MYLSRVKKLIIFILVLVYCGSVHAAPRAVSNRTLIIADAFRALPIHPLLTSSTISAVLLDLIYDPLIEYRSDGEIQPALARQLEISKDGLEWIFKLNKGVKFHNGKEMTAYDVKATYEALLSLKDSFYSFGFFNVKSIDVTSDYEVHFKLKRFDAFLSFFFRHVFIMPKDIAESKSNNVPVIGTGPFKLTFFSPEHIELAANDKYFKGEPFLKRIVVNIYPNQRKCLAKLIAEEADMTLLTDIRDYDIFANVETVELISYPVEWAYLVVFNLRNPLLAKKDMRKALNLAVNKDRMHVHETSIISESKLNFTSPYNPVEAIRIIKDLQKHTKRTGEPGIVLRLTLSEEDEVAKRMAAFLQANFKSVGIDLQFDVVSSYDKLAEKCFVEKKFDMMLMPSNMRSGIPRHYLFWHSSQIENGSNFSGYNNRDVDRLLDEIRYNPDPQKRREAEIELSKVLSEDPPGIPLFVKGVPALVNTKFVGFSSDPFNFFRSLRNVKVKGSE